MRGALAEIALGAPVSKPYESSFSRRGLYLETHNISQTVAAAIDMAVAEQSEAPLARIAEILMQAGDPSLTGLIQRQEKQIDYLLSTRASLEYKLDQQQRALARAEAANVRLQELEAMEAELAMIKRQCSRYEEQNALLETRDLARRMREAELEKALETERRWRQDYEHPTAEPPDEQPSPPPVAPDVAPLGWHEEQQKLREEITRLKRALDEQTQRSQSTAVGHPIPAATPAETEGPLMDSNTAPAPALAPAPASYADELSTHGVTKRSTLIVETGREIETPVSARAVPVIPLPSRPATGFVVVGTGKVRQSFVGQDECELSVNEGDALRILRPAEPTPRGYIDVARLAGWLYAMSDDGSEGLVPESYVDWKGLQEQEVPSSPQSDSSYHACTTEDLASEPFAAGEMPDEDSAAAAYNLALNPDRAD